MRGMHQLCWCLNKIILFFCYYGKPPTKIPEKRRIEGSTSTELILTLKLLENFYRAIFPWRHCKNVKALPFDFSIACGLWISNAIIQRLLCFGDSHVDCTMYKTNAKACCVWFYIWSVQILHWIDIKVSTTIPRWIHPFSSDHGS